MLSYSQVLRNKFILPFGSLLIFGSAMFGSSNHVLAGNVHRYEIGQNVSFQPNVNRNNQNATHLKFGSRTIFIPDKIIYKNDK